MLQLVHKYYLVVCMDSKYMDWVCIEAQKILVYIDRYNVIHLQHIVSLLDKVVSYMDLDLNWEKNIYYYLIFFLKQHLNTDKMKYMIKFIILLLLETIYKTITDIVKVLSIFIYILVTLWTRSFLFIFE